MKKYLVIALFLFAVYFAYSRFVAPRMSGAA